MSNHVIRTSEVNGQRIEIAHWEDDDLYSVRIYDQEGLLSDGVRHFRNLYAAEQFYLDRLSQLAGCTP